MSRIPSSPATFSQTVENTGSDPTNARIGSANDGWMHGEKFKDEVMAKRSATLSKPHHRGSFKPICFGQEKHGNFGF